MCARATIWRKMLAGGTNQFSCYTTRCSEFDQLCAFTKLHTNCFQALCYAICGVPIELSMTNRSSSSCTYSGSPWQQASSYHGLCIECTYADKAKALSTYPVGKRRAEGWGTCSHRFQLETLTSAWPAVGDFGKVSPQGQR